MIGLNRWNIIIIKRLEKVITRFNACVGNNGLFEGKYFHGYDLSVKVLIESLLKSTAEIDHLIFPILFNARHAIELYLKDAITYIYEINESIAPKRDCDIVIGKLHKTHDLSILWQTFERNSVKLDRRIQEYIDFQREYISDYFEIDLKGETFRYQYTKENNVHLAKTPLVNIIHFSERYNELSKSMHDFNFFINQVRENYYYGSYTETLSHPDLVNISKKLGNLTTWKDDKFKDIKAAIKTEYAIGSKELSNAINIIKGKPEYSKFIGVENYIFHIPKEKISAVIKIFEESKTIIKKIMRSLVLLQLMRYYLFVFFVVIYIKI